MTKMKEIESLDHNFTAALVEESNVIILIFYKIYINILKNLLINLLLKARKSNEIKFI